MSTAVVVGAQWGDEGKGKIVDLATERAEVVIRYAGGPNAGHTLVVGDQRVVVRLVPSGILQPHARCIMGQGMVVDLAVLFGEIDALEQRGVSTKGRLIVADRAHLILPFHIEIDGLREASAKAGKIGTTKKGIGPCYEDKAARRGLRLVDLRDLARARRIVEATAHAWAPVIAALGGAPIDPDAVIEGLRPYVERVLPLLADGSAAADAAIRAGQRVLFEGAQGTLLDVDHGTYPFVTSSHAVAGGACTGAGVGPSRIKKVVGITKAYATRVGEGPFPSELFDATGERIRTRGGEFGSVTGRPRRTGWLDLPALRYAARVNGIDAWAITKLDVLTGLDEVKVCVAYTRSGADAERIDDLPSDGIAELAPVYRSFPGWSAPIEAARALEDLPAEARALVTFIEESTGVPADLVSVGPARDATIVRRDIFAA
ncbi:MAG: adenylosuccinate synthase [Polyangiaceae bacterium]